ncbi:MAG: TolC family protein, partial [Gammaproteobacteria bacterium]|nr:TolC family protein [Gammaproteobacteria bacterium]
GREGQGLNQKIEFDQKIPWPGTLAARRAVAEHQAAKARTDVETLRLELAALAKSAYAEWFFIQRALAIHHSTYVLLGELLAVAQTRYAAGTALQQDAIQAEMEQVNLQRHLLQLQRLQTSVRAGINALLNRETSASLPVPVDIATPVTVPALAELERYALDTHPELRRVELQIAANVIRVTLAEKAFYPDFHFSAGYNSLWDEADKRPVIGMSINLPLDRGKRRAALNSARANVRLATSQRDNLRTRLFGEIAQARSELVESVDAVVLYQTSLLPLAIEYLQATVADYRSGAGAFLAVITAEQQKLAVEESLERNRADILRGIAKLEHLSGRNLKLYGQALSGERS